VFAANHIDRVPLAHSLALPLVRNPSILPPYRKFAWGIPAGFQAEALGNTLHTRKYRFEVIHTPGHSPDHVVLHEPDKRWLFAGDLYISKSLSVTTRDENVTALMSSLRKLMELPDCQMFCQHSGMHDSHQRALGARLEFLLATQKKALALHAEGRTAGEIARELELEKPAIRLVSRGEMSARHLVNGLLRDAGVETADG